MRTTDDCGSYRKGCRPGAFAHLQTIKYSTLLNVTTVLATSTLSKAKYNAAFNGDFQMGFSSLDVPRMLLLQTAAVLRWRTSHLHLQPQQWQTYASWLVTLSGYFLS
jgi:hypothetical protein